MSNASVFAALHTAPELLLLPNAWDVASGLLLADAGYSAIGTTSLGITAAAGLPDGAGAGRELTVALAAGLVSRLPVPLTVDLEGGYSDDPAQVAALAAALGDLGVAGINLEDGRPDGNLRTPGEHATIIRAVTDAAPGLFVNARTDTYWHSAGSDHARLDETLSRLAAYRDAGADGVFVPGLTDLTAIEHVAVTVARPLNVLWQSGVDLDDLRAVGVARVSTGSALYRHALAAALHTAAAARSGASPATTAVPYDDVQKTLQRHPGQEPRSLPNPS